MTTVGNGRIAVALPSRAARYGLATACGGGDGAMYLFMLSGRANANVRGVTMRATFAICTGRRALAMRGTTGACVHVFSTDKGIYLRGRVVGGVSGVRMPSTKLCVMGVAGSRMSCAAGIMVRWCSLSLCLAGGEGRLGASMWGRIFE